jgi:hypothetical protein
VLLSRGNIAGLQPTSLTACYGASDSWMRSLIDRAQCSQHLLRFSFGARNASGLTAWNWCFAEFISEIGLLELADRYERQNIDQVR